MFLEDSIEKLRGIGPKKADRLKVLGIEKIKHFLFIFPKRYINLESLTPISKIIQDKKQLISGKIINLNLFYTYRKRIAILEGLIQDKTGSIKFQFFNQPYLYKALNKKEVYFYGKPNYSSRKLVFQNPLYEYKSASWRSETSQEKFLPIYSKISDLSSKQVRFLIQQILKETHVFPDILPKEISQKFGLYSLEFAVKILHRPKTLEALLKAKKTWAILELLNFILQRSTFKKASSRHSGISLKIYNLKKYIKKLPFSLTKDQKKALKDILVDLSLSRSQSRLLNGDVGSGKTIIAFLAMINAILNQSKAVLMAPTEILAYQHFLNFQRFFGGFKFKVILLTNIWKFKLRQGKIVILKKDDIASALKKADLVFGTHALLEKRIEIPNLALAVIDEQQRFGVKQRAILRRKNLGKILPHLLMLTATPIPRTLAFVIFKDLNISFLHNAPFVKNTKTEITIESDRPKIYQKIKDELARKNQAFVICPIIEQKETLDFDDRKAAEVEFKKIKQSFPQYKIGLLHGRMKSQEKEKAIENFRMAKTQILVSTSVVEVGVDIPKATVLLVETAERFGLSQLHQLRGRIGRFGQESFCFFMASSKNATKKLKILEKTTDGFLISQTDLKQRGPGEILGEEQHGFLKFRFANLFNQKLLNEVKTISEELEKENLKIDFEILK